MIDIELKSAGRGHLARAAKCLDGEQVALLHADSVPARGDFYHTKPIYFQLKTKKENARGRGLVFNSTYELEEIVIVGTIKTKESLEEKKESLSVKCLDKKSSNEKKENWGGILNQKTQTFRREKHAIGLIFQQSPVNKKIL